MKKGPAIFVLSVLAMTAKMNAEEEVVQFLPLSVNSVSDAEGRIIEALIVSYISEMDGIIVYPSETTSMETPASAEEAPDTHRPADYTLSGSLSLEDGATILRIDVDKNASGEHYLYTSAHKTTSSLALKIRSIVEDVWAQLNAENRVLNEPLRETIVESSIHGIWRGDGGVEMLRFLPNGRGMAVFSSGVNMNLSYTIENNTLKVAQTSLNYARYYHPLPLPVAEELVKAAEPMKWEMYLYDNGTQLKGVRIETAVQFEGENVFRFIPGAIKQAEWSKLAR
jgi:hypothetical protein